MTTMRFFMIGSWVNGQVNFNRIQSFITQIQKAQIKATVYKNSLGYPVMTESPNFMIQGQLIEICGDDTLFALIDTFFGVKLSEPSKGLHFKLQRVVVLEDESEVESTVYFLNPKKLNNSYQLIPKGEWETFLKENPPLPLGLTDKQKTYVLKLGAVKGRDIIPINDLALYRELMKLELIVDKGRRLALSSLGKEVYNHLT